MIPWLLGALLVGAWLYLLWQDFRDDPPQYKPEDERQT